MAIVSYIESFLECLCLGILALIVGVYRVAKRHPIISSLILFYFLTLNIFKFLGFDNKTANIIIVALGFSFLGGSSNKNNNQVVPRCEETKPRVKKYNREESVEVQNKLKRFRVDYFLKGYPNVTQEYVYGHNMYEIQQRYKVNPIVSKLVTVREVK